MGVFLQSPAISGNCMSHPCESPVSVATPAQDSNGNKCSDLNFNDLPYEIQLKIFSYLTVQELCQKVVLVCHQWRNVAYDPALWKHLYFKVHEKETAQLVISVLKRASLLRSLSMRASVLQASELALCTPSFGLLTSLDLGFCDFVDNTLIECFVENCPLIECLNVEGCFRIDQKAINAIIHLNHLKSLNLSHCNLLTDEAVITIALKCSDLRHLNIDGITRITDRSICLLGNNLRNSLRKIALDGEELTDASIGSLGRCSLLFYFSISFGEEITDKSLEYIKELKCLKCLKLRRAAKLSNAALSNLFSGPNMRNLVSLKFDSLVLEDSGVAAISKCCPLLKYLSLAWCWEITEAGLEMIILNCRKLEELDLLGLYNLTGVCLLKIPECLPNLTLLNLEQCNHITDSILHKLVRLLPSLKIFDYYGEIVPLTEDDES